MRVFLNDTDVLVALKNGDEQAFDHIYGLYYKPLCYFAEKFTGNSAVAEDIASESFVKLLQRNPVFESLSSLKSFLYTSTKNACLDQLRMKKRHQANQLRMVYQSATSEEVIESNIIIAEVLQAIYAAIEELPHKYKQVVKMALVEGKDNDEIVTETGMAYQTVRNHKSEGIKLLRMNLFKNNDISRSALIIAMLILSGKL